MSTELVKRDGDGLATPDEINHQLTSLREQGDTEALLEASRQAAVYQEYEKRQDARARANAYARIKVMAEAHIGVIDVREHPFRSTATNGKNNGKALDSLHIGENEISPESRGIWRSLGMAMMRNLLDDALRRIDDADEDVGTYSVWRHVKAMGTGYVPRSELIQLVGVSGLSRMEVAKRVASEMGVGWSGVYSALAHQKNSPRIVYSRAEKIAGVIGLDPLELSPAPPKKHLRSKGRKSRLRRDRRLKGGRWDRAYSLHRKTMEEIFAITGETAHSGLWSNLHAAEDFLRRRV